MLEFTIAQYASNLFYQSQSVFYVDLLNREFEIIGIRPWGADYELTMMNEYDEVVHRVLGDHEMLFVDLELETADDL
jgi:hypothetical protein